MCGFRSLFFFFAFFPFSFWGYFSRVNGIKLSVLLIWVFRGIRNRLINVISLVLFVTPKRLLKRVYLLLFIYCLRESLIMGFIKTNYVRDWQILPISPFAMSKYQVAVQNILISQRIFQMSRTPKPVSMKTNGNLRVPRQINQANIKNNTKILHAIEIQY